MYNTLSSAFKVHSEKILVKPHPDPDHVEATEYLSKNEIQEYVIKPSKEFIEAGGSEVPFR